MSAIRNIIRRLVPAQLSRAAWAGVTICALLTCSALAVSARSWLSSPSAPGQAETVSLTLSARGFEPAQMARPAGRIQLVVENRSGVEGLTLRLKREPGETVQEYQVPAGAAQRSGEVELTAGRYTLMEANQPAWLFHLTIE